MSQSVAAPTHGLPGPRPTLAFSIGQDGSSVGNGMLIVIRNRKQIKYIITKGFNHGENKQSCTLSKNQVVWGSPARTLRSWMLLDGPVFKGFLR